MPGLPGIYKRNQGRYTRSITAVGLTLGMGTLCYYIFTMLVSYLPTEKPTRMPVDNATEAWVVAAAWPNADKPQIAVDSPVTPEVKAKFKEAGIDRWDFRAAHPVPYALYLQYGIPAGLFVLAAAGIFLLVNHPQFADFLIATEGEMKKVSWSSKEELIGSTVVVIVTVFILAALIYVSDFFWTLGLKLVGALPSG